MKTKSGLSLRKTNAEGRLLAALSLCLVFSFSNSLFSAEIPLEKLLEPDVGVCVRIPQLKKRMDELQNSSFYTALKNSKFYEAWTSHQSHLAMEISLKKFQANTEHSFENFIDDFVGESVCLAFSPDKQNPKKTVAIFITQAKSPEHIDKWMKIWNKKYSMLEDKTKRFEEQEYSIQTTSRKVGDQTVSKKQYFAKLGKLFVLTDSEKDMKRIIQRRNRLQKRSYENFATSAGSLHDARWFRSAVGNLSKDSLCQIVVNPRVWDSTMEPMIAKHNFFSTLWKNADTLSVGIQLQNGPVAEAYVGFRMNNLPEDWQQFVKRSEGKNEFIKHIPSNAIVFGSGRHDLSLIVRALLDVATSTEGNKLREYFQTLDLAMKGFSRIEKFLPALKNNWGAFLVARDSQNSTRIPFNAMLALEVPKSKLNKTQVPLRLFLSTALNASFETLSKGYNNTKLEQSHSRLISEDTTDGKLTWIDSIGSFQPAFTMTSHYMLVSSSPNLIRNHLDPKAGGSVLTNPVYRKTSRFYFPEFSQILFLNTSALVSLLDKNEEYFSSLASRSEAISDAVARKRLATTQDFFRIFDAFFVTMNVKKNGFKLTLGATRIRP